jgi:acyl-CoA dehydrogenase
VSAVDTLFEDALSRLLADACPPARVRGIERGDDWRPLWSALADAGFADAMLPEEGGGAGLGLESVLPLLGRCGEAALPLPLGATMLLRGWLAANGAALPEGAITLAAAPARREGDRVCAAEVPLGATADWVLLELDGGLRLLPTAGADLRPAPEGRSGLRADLGWPADAAQAARAVAAFDWRAAGSWLAAAHSAGALESLLERTLQHARERTQFGRAIGGFQAVQHQLAVMAEEVAAARAAVRLGAVGATSLPGRLPAALAKARTAEAAARCAAIAHALHGAMGITAEFDLQLLTRRLHDWRLAFGTESYWHAVLGREWLADGESGALDFVRDHLS